MEFERFYKNNRSLILQVAAVAGIGVGGTYFVHETRGGSEPNQIASATLEKSQNPPESAVYDQESSLTTNGDFEDVLTITSIDETGREIEIPVGWIDEDHTLKHFGIAKNMGINGSNALFLEVFKNTENQEKGPTVMQTAAIPIEETTDYAFEYKIKNLRSKKVTTNNPSLALVVHFVFLDENNIRLGYNSVIDIPGNSQGWSSPGTITIGPKSEFKTLPGTKKIEIIFGVTPASNGRESYLGDKILIDHVYFGKAKPEDLQPKTPAGRT